MADTMILACAEPLDAAGACTSTVWVSAASLGGLPTLSMADASLLATAIVSLWVVAYFGRKVRHILENRH